MFNVHEYRRRPRQLADLLPWAGLIAPGVVLNKDGSFQATLRFRGPDASAATMREQVALRARVHNALRRLGDGWCFHIESRRTKHSPPVPTAFANAAAQCIEDERCASLTTQPAYESVLYLTLTYLPPEERTRRITKFLLTHPDTDAASEPTSYSAYRDAFVRRIAQTVDLLRGVFLEVECLDDTESLAFLHDAVSSRTLRPKFPQALGVPFYLDALLTDSPLQAGLDLRLGDRHLRVLSVRAFPDTSTPCLLRALDELPLEFRWVVRFMPLEKNEAKALLGKLRRQWFAKRKGAWALLKEAITKTESALDDPESHQKTGDIEAALDDLAGDYVSYGYFTLTVTTWGSTPAEADNRLNAIRRVTDGQGLVTEAETFNALQAWLGGIPGNAFADVRRPPLSTLNLCDLMPMSSVWTGMPANAHLDGPPLIETQTAGATPFRFSLHYGDVGHTLIVGPTGGGKSTLLNVIAAQWLRYPGAQVFTFDVGGSGQVLTHAIGGDFYRLGDAAETPAFQPLARIDEDDERSWAQDWVLDLAEHGGIAINAPARDELWSALNALATRPVRERTLGTLWAYVQSDAVRQALHTFTVDGPNGYLLDADVETCGNSAWQVFELEALMHRPRALLPLLTYLFHRLESRFRAERPSLLILDEAWMLLGQGRFAAQIREWLKTLRKKNVAVVFSTQSLADISESPIASAIVESCPTRVYLPNPSANEPNVFASYTGLGLNDRQIETLVTAIPKRDYLYHSPLGCRWFQLGLGPLALSLCGTQWMSEKQAIDRLARSQTCESFLHAFLKHAGVREPATPNGVNHE